jgi:hypothetical protein
MPADIDIGPHDYHLSRPHLGRVEGVGRRETGFHSSESVSISGENPEFELMHTAGSIIFDRRHPGPAMIRHQVQINP